MFTLEANGLDSLSEHIMYTWQNIDIATSKIKHVSSNFQNIPLVLFLFLIVPNLQSKIIFNLHKVTNTSDSINQNNNVNMQSRLAEATRRASCALSSTTRFTLRIREFCSGTRSRTADPEIHTGEQERGPAVHRGQPQGISTSDKAKEAKIAETERNANKAHELLRTPKSPCEPSVKLKSEGVNQRLDPNIQQKRKHGSVSVEDVSCVGFDGSPWPEDKSERKEKDNREYFKDHKASPLSELEFADSRKPISRASDKTADSGGGVGVIGWLPEQLETAEETLLRAAEMWRQRVMRGDPDLPHSRVLRQLRGEDF